MARWQEVLQAIAFETESNLDAVKARLGQMLGRRGSMAILPYRGIGSQSEVHLRGRVLTSPTHFVSDDDDSLWENLVHNLKRMESDEVPGARLLARFQDQQLETLADGEGFFEFNFQPHFPLSGDSVWRQVYLELQHPTTDQPVRAVADVLVAPPAARFGVISDIDDTVLQAHVTNPLSMASQILLGSAHTRLPFAGAAAFYRALHAGGGGQDGNPLVYVSSSPWNLYDLLSEFFHLHDIPVGPVLFLRDWGISESEIMPVRHHAHKLKAIQRVMGVYADLPFLLVGDSGQADPEIYRQAVSLYPDRIKAVYIRHVRTTTQRTAGIAALAGQIAAAGSQLVLAEDSLTMAQHAQDAGWITAEAVEQVRADQSAGPLRLSPSVVPILAEVAGEEEDTTKPEAA